jgi:uncharacterized protein DUF3631
LAVLFRKIAKDCPTLLLDEADAIFGPKASTGYEGLRAILNSGNRRGADVPRVSMDGRGLLTTFKVFCPKALAGIGRLPDTIEDRSIVIRLQRRRLDVEPIERFRFVEAEALAQPIRMQLAALLNGESLRSARPTMPDTLGDRAQDNWEPLVAIADLAKGSWPGRARGAAAILSGDIDADEEGLGGQLLKDARAVFDMQGVDRLATADLLEALRGLDESPWTEVNGGRGVSPHYLARLLRPYGIHSSNVREGALIKKGFHRANFENAWSRWLPSSSREAQERYTATSDHPE